MWVVAADLVRSCHPKVKRRETFSPSRVFAGAVDRSVSNTEAELLF